MEIQQLNDTRIANTGQVEGQPILKFVADTTGSENDKNNTIKEALFCSGFGQYHTNEVDPDKPDKNLTAYGNIMLDRIRKMIDSPQSVPKAKAHWVIPSTTPSRNFHKQETEGEFWLLWVDIDENAQPIDELENLLISINGDCQYEIYTTSSATEKNQKARILIPLKIPLNGSDWVLCQQTLNDCLEASGVIPDRAAERPAQLCYLPNTGKFYKSLSNRTGEYFNPLERFKSEIKAKKLAIVVCEQETQARRNASEKRRAKLKYTGGNAKSLISVFNDAYSVEDILIPAGYKQRGNTFCHSNSSSGSYAATFKNGRVHSLNGTDPLNAGNGAHDAFSAFCILFHGGDEKAALIDAGNEWIKVDGQSWNKVKQREYKKKEAEQNKSNAKPFVGDIPKNHAIKFKHIKELKNGETKVLATRENLETLMKHKKIGVAYDVIKKRAVISNVRSLKGEEENAIIAKLKSDCGLHSLSKSVVDDQLTAIMHDNASNPVTDWLKSTKRTKNHNPVHALVDSLPISNKAWAETAFYRWFIQCVAAADRSEHTPNKNALPKYESVLTFFGGQGLLKTAFIRSLLPENLKSYLKDGILLDLTNKDSKIEALSAWLTELGELDSTFKKSEISALKAFLSRQEDEIRKSYAKAASIMPRQTSFFGSVNEERFLRDGTGNRRYFPIVVNAQLSIPNDFDCTDLWAFIWSQYINGEQWWLTREEEALQKSALARHEDDQMKGMLLDEFNFDNESRNQSLTGNDILDRLHIARSRTNSTTLGLELKKLNINKSNRVYQMPVTRDLRRFAN